ncbi:lipopolysaccharide heptosyltransferase I [Sulfurimicrobium lacus]|uniref:Lipopolysaccharide heptosyltransferase 1 n=1 Tax=Sulfurimicrobium lacus TaxID=2715678 RepID=A0A6F8V7X3_9PROT|nr:lipopolysaccharide heptosyltransferase I [Sulfurimicrobium lacus]BCB25217.1 lipopolysaccharide heptosyltransferase I [Sulfurimicrobium lacus]
MLKILLVKTSSLGDVIHQLPAITDIRTHFPDARIDWVVEENFVELPALHPGVSRVIPVAVRRWRRALLNPATWREMAAFRQALQSLRYDMVLDSQGLVKSAAITLLAPGPHCGYDRASAREAIAALAYDKTIAIPKNLHAVERNRRLAGRALGYEPDTPVDYGVATPQTELSWLSSQPYAVLLHATSRADKEWPEADWLLLAAHLHASGMSCILPWGSSQEKERSERLAAQMANALVAPRLNLTQAAALLGNARAVVGVDTGLTHLAAALKVPVVALYCASEPGLTGVYTAGPGVNLGQAGRIPNPEEVIAALSGVMAA